MRRARALTPRCRRGAMILAVTLFAFALCFAQDPSEEADPIKLFELGQNAHAARDYARALQLYDQALALRPEFPEAEFQKAMALLALKRTDEALSAFARVVDLRPQWAFAYASFGAALSTLAGREKEAETALRRALELEPQNGAALMALARLRYRLGAVAEARQLAQRATALPEAKASDWRERALIERASGDLQAALASLNRALAIAPDDPAIRLDRAQLLLALGEPNRAREDLRIAEAHLQDDAALLTIARLWSRVGERERARNALAKLSEAAQQDPEAIILRADLATGELDASTRAALERALARDPQNAALLAHLGEAYRRIDPERALEYFRRAVQLAPQNSDYAAGYGAALVQARRFAEAATVLQRVLALDPNNYAAHANLATAFDELRLYERALAEYEWIRRARPDLAIADYFIGRTLDLLGRYEEALAAYERFLARADREKNSLEIERVNLRLPRLREQIKRSDGKRRG
ncbi:tetratricopeptide repeat protein [Pyrinomonas methylaliphatogenes]|uniref:Tetratricopeptide repeat/TPR repeat n=1 Tax=Pyrinomonas methylaliphatogenes TaxID=454194 RepID=A0A0B6WXK2_9BACT|nr:tetratricopeptide repeat protein [Pyrinomonas methylaliphatogenes]CDM65457.1 Tetratricopeptide repeat/TPR repeat [Pyrinomonas methylaliphatogenes]